MNPNYDPATDPRYATTMDFVPPDLFPWHDAAGNMMTGNWIEYNEALAAGNVSKPNPDVSTALELSDMYNPDELPRWGGLR